MDVDIDLKTDFDPLQFFKTGIRASMIKEGELLKHPAGIYFQSVPKDQLTGLCAIPYDAAEQLGLLKVDFLHLSVLDHFTSKEQIRILSKTPPDWSLLEDRNVVKKLFHIHNYYNLVQKVRPKSVSDLADLLALIRPGKKKFLDGYLFDRDKVRPFLYQKEEGQYAFKRSHAISYALTIVLQLHLIKGKIL